MSPYGDDPDAPLIRRLQAGEVDAFRELVETRGPRLFRYLTRAAGRHAEAEDLYQETLLKVADGIRQYRHQGTLDAWLFRVARNVWLDARKRRGVDEVELPDDDLLADRQGTEDGPLPGSPGSDLESEVHEALATLGPKLREVFVLRIHGELAFREIAEVVGAPLGTVLARMSYALRALRPRLAGRVLEARREVS